MGHCFSTNQQDIPSNQQDIPSNQQDKPTEQKEQDKPTEQKEQDKPTEQKEQEEQKEQTDPYMNATYENTPEYTLEGLRSTVKILRILDGDTVDIALYHTGVDKVYRHRVRLNGIDTPEKRPALSDPNRHLEIEASKRSKEALEQRIKENDERVVAVFYRPDKYGRLLCTFYDKNGDDINKWMITNGFAYEYHGKTKKAFEISASPL